MKTYQDWEKSGKDLDDYLDPFDEIDEELFEYAISVIPPYFWNYGYLQVGEPFRHEGRTVFFETFQQTKTGYFYLGILPEFKL